MKYDEYEMQNRFEKYKDSLKLSISQMEEFLGFVRLNPEDIEELTNILSMIRKKSKKISKIDNYEDSKKYIRLKIMYNIDKLKVGESDEE